MTAVRFLFMANEKEKNEKQHEKLKVFLFRFNDHRLFGSFLIK